jgi:hypothetical protein
MVRGILKGLVAGWVVKKVRDRYRRRQVRDM